jgi:hypothetical protein
VKSALALILILGPVALAYFVGEPRWTPRPGSFRRSAVEAISRSELLQVAITLVCVAAFTLGLALLTFTLDDS